MTEQDHNDPSILEEPAPLRVGHDHPNWDQSWGANLTYEFIDKFAAIHIKDEEDFRQHCLSYKIPFTTEPMTNVRLAVRLLKMMERHELAPPKAWLSWNCIGTVAQSQWVMDRVEEHGIPLNRAEYENRLKGE